MFKSVYLGLRFTGKCCRWRLSLFSNLDIVLSCFCFSNDIAVRNGSALYLALRALLGTGDAILTYSSDLYFSWYWILVR